MTTTPSTPPTVAAVVSYPAPPPLLEPAAGAVTGEAVVAAMPLVESSGVGGWVVGFELAAPAAADVAVG